jgi:drug/metabolite transporter (DMT)-like permease
MTLASVGLILISAAIHVGWNLTTKSSSNPKVFSALKGLVVLVAGTITFGLLGLRMVPPNILLIALASGIIHGIYVYGLSCAYEEGDLSLVYPVVRSSPAFVPVAAWLFLGESVSLRGVMGIAIVVACIFALQWRQLSSLSISGLRTLVTSRATLWSFVTLGTVVTYSLVDKEGMTQLKDSGALPPHLRDLVFFLLMGSISNITIWIILIATGIRGVKAVLSCEWKIILIAAVGMASSYNLILHVMQTEKISYIVTLRQSSILMATILGWLVLKERHGPFRVFVSIIMILGFVLVVFAE